MSLLDGNKKYRSHQVHSWCILIASQQTQSQVWAFDWTTIKVRRESTRESHALFSRTCDTLFPRELHSAQEDSCKKLEDFCLKMSLMLSCKIVNFLSHVTVKSKWTTINLCTLYSDSLKKEVVVITSQCLK